MTRAISKTIIILNLCYDETSSQLGYTVDFMSQALA